MRGTYGSFKMDVPGSDKSFCLKGDGGSEIVAVFESAIDALSGATLRKLSGQDREDSHYRPDFYAALVASEQLYEHCAEIEDAARSRLDIIIPQLTANAGATEALKAQDPMRWVGLMNACKAQAEEV